MGVHSTLYMCWNTRNIDIPTTQRQQGGGVQTNRKDLGVPRIFRDKIWKCLPKKKMIKETSRNPFVEVKKSLFSHKFKPQCVVFCALNLSKHCKIFANHSLSYVHV